VKIKPFQMPLQCNGFAFAPSHHWSSQTLTSMGSAYSRKQISIDQCFNGGPSSLRNWDLHHVKILHTQFRLRRCEFGMDRHAFIALIADGLPQGRAKASEFWDQFVNEGDEVIYPLELFAWIALQCHGLTR
jgi:hypothetical protein